MLTFARQNRFTLTIPNAEPEFRVLAFDGPGNGVHGQISSITPPMDGRATPLARSRRPIAWIHGQQAQAERWDWLEQEHLEFLALHGLPRPGYGVPGGWKRCMGKGFEDQYAFCRGNDKDFSSFIMPDAKQCTIYPGCAEQRG